ncbi:uncharacterized protein TNIN_113911 [Trichonephila inaurata madagascariensis]|uniref:Uncharacterized protein n=1 Tax=Trichonephila inaurata madagascariensis TaxID=2747483 RepID=A0A8X6IJP7_9ARAC|nr:uncharacterized protein TNIN_113911 [Trichonephila inaurata madagascariensis]
MKIFLVLLLVGCATAALHDVLEKAVEDAVNSFREALEQTQPLHEALGIEENEFVTRLQSDVRDELIKHIEKLFRDALKKIDEAVRNGKTVNKEAYEKLKNLKESLKDLDVTEHEIEGFKKQVSLVLQRILEQMGIFDKRSVEEDPMESMLGDLSFRDFFLKIKNMILEKMDVSALKKGLAKAIRQASQSLCHWLTSKGEEKLNNFFDRVLEKDEEGESKRAVSDLYEQLKDYFDNLQVDFKEKFAKFGEWVKHLVETGMEKSKNKVENVRNVARERKGTLFLEMDCKLYFAEVSLHCSFVCYNS